MRWFKHDSDANTDAKLLKLRIKYGMEGYGLYWYCLELIVNEIGESNLTFELEHDAEVISHQTGIHHERVNEMMAFMVNLRLFEVNGNSIRCIKILRRLDKSMTSNESFRNMITSAKKSHDLVMIKSDEVMQDLTTLDLTTPKKHGQMTRFADFWEVYPRKVKKADALKKWKSKGLDGIADVLIADVKNRTANDTGWKSAEFIPHPTTYLNGERWNDEIETAKRGKLTYAEELAADMRDKGMI